MVTNHESEGTGPSEGVSAGVIWREAIRLAGIVCAQGADGRRSRGDRPTKRSSFAKASEDRDA